MNSITPYWREEKVTVFFKLGQHEFEFGSYERTEDGKFKVKNVCMGGCDPNKDAVYCSEIEVRQYLESLIPTEQANWRNDGDFCIGTYTLGNVRKSYLTRVFSAFIYSRNVRSHPMQRSGFVNNFVTEKEARKFVETELCLSLKEEDANETHMQ